MNAEIKTKLLKVTLEYEDKIMTIEGTDAEKWNNHNLAVSQIAQIHNMNPFKDDPIIWTITDKRDNSLFFVTPMQFSQEECPHNCWERGRCEDCGYSPYDDQEYGA